MDNDIDAVTHLAIELILCALVIGAVALCCTIGYGMYYDKQMTDDTNELRANIVELYFYDNKVVSGYDALELMMTNTRRYSYWFDLGTDTIEISTRYENIKPAVETEFVGEWTYRDYWSESTLRKLTSGFINNKFKASLVFDEAKTYIKGIMFEIGG